ncbi:MAG: hypothetical protein R2940_07465 [Syntrophotaleaceae bacterium]
MKIKSIDIVPKTAFKSGWDTQRIWDWFQSVRLSHLLTAMADVLAGYLIIAGSDFRLSLIAPLLLSAGCLTAAGSILNELQAMQDGRQEPGPLPFRQGVLLCLALFGSGLGAASMAGGVALLGAVVVTGHMAAYYLFFKSGTILGPAAMGLFRAEFLFLGMAPVVSGANMVMLLPLLTFGYVFLLAFLEQQEAREEPSFSGRWITVGAAVLYLALFGLVAVHFLKFDALPFLLLLLLFTGPALFRCFLRPRSLPSRSTANVLLFGIPLLSAVYVAGVQGWLFGIPVALFILPGFWLFWKRRGDKQTSIPDGEG